MKNLERFKNLGHILSKTQQKKILGGDGGPCQEKGEACSSADNINCCSGLTCGDFKCHTATP